MEASPDEVEEIFNITKDTLINQSAVFFGGYAVALYSKYMPAKLQKKLKNVPDFDVLSTDPKTTSEILKERLSENDIKNVQIKYHKAIGEVIPESYEVKVGKDTIANIYATIGCHSYNSIDDGEKEIKVATIDTMLSFYLAFLYGYGNIFEGYSDRILCMAQFLFDVQEKNRLSQKGLLRRFSITCYGHQESLEEMRAHKADKMKELKDKRGTRIYDENFLIYKPAEVKKTIIKFKGKSKSKTKSGDSTSSSSSSSSSSNSSSSSSSSSSSDGSRNIRRRKPYKRKTRNNKKNRKQQKMKRKTQKNIKRR
jgi:hypothetical protein